MPYGSERKGEGALFHGCVLKWEANIVKNQRGGSLPGVSVGNDNSRKSIRLQNGIKNDGVSFNMS